MPFERGVIHKHKSPGRPKGFRKMARDIMGATHQGKDLLAFALKIFEDKKQPMRWRWEAFEWLTQYGIGRPLQPLELAAHLEEPPPRLDLGKLTPEQRAALRDVLTNARTTPPRTQQIEEVHVGPGAAVLRIMDGGEVSDETDRDG